MARLRLEALDRRRRYASPDPCHKSFHDGLLAGVAHADNVLEEKLAVVRGILLELVENDLLVGVQLSTPVSFFRLGKNTTGYDTSLLTRCGHLRGRGFSFR